MWAFAVAIISYLFLGGFFGGLTKLKLTPAVHIKDHGLDKPASALAIVTGLFWPIAMPIWAGIFLVRLLGE